MKLILILFFLTLQVFADVQFPALDRPVIDQAGWLGAENTELETWIHNFQQSGHGQI